VAFVLEAVISLCGLELDIEFSDSVSEGGEGCNSVAAHTLNLFQFCDVQVFHEDVKRVVLSIDFDEGEGLEVVSH
jgi:hypothetical protein